MQILQFLASLFFFVATSCAAHTYRDCSPSQVDKIKLGVANASKYAANVIAENDPVPFFRWMGYNEISDVKQTFAEIKEALDGDDIFFSCYCFDIKLAAMSVPEESYIIALCPYYFHAPMNGVDSKPGILIHELSHAKSIAGTQDIILMHYPDECLRAAKVKQSQSMVIKNANSYEYLAEDINNPGDPQLHPNDHQSGHHNPR